MLTCRARRVPWAREYLISRRLVAQLETYRHHSSFNPPWKIFSRLWLTSVEKVYFRMPRIRLLLQNLNYRAISAPWSQHKITVIRIERESRLSYRRTISWRYTNPQPQIILWRWSTARISMGPTNRNFWEISRLQFRISLRSDCKLLWWRGGTRSWLE